MPEARDRLERPVDYAVEFLNRPRHGILLDEPALRLNMLGSPIERSSIGTVRNTAFRHIDRALFEHRGGLGRRLGNVRGQNPRLLQGRENTPATAAWRGRGRASTSVLPSWYPRTPLRDITTIVRAIERRRAHIREVDGQEIGTLTPHQVGVLDSSVPLVGAELEHNSSMVTPAPAVRLKRSCPPSSSTIHKILLDITKEESGEAEFLTPQKKLLNSIEKVEKVVVEEMQKLKSTPSAKRADRETRVRTLMLMR